jgi:dimethylaniline monooxygenase (N-oxide forming)
MPTDTAARQAQPVAGLAAEACIIGAGFSGITAAKALKQAGVAFDCFERGSALGGMWRYDNDSGTSSAYRSLHIDSSRPSISYRDFPIPDHLPDYLSHWQVLEHLENYADHYGISRLIRLRTNVDRIEPLSDGSWSVALSPVGRKNPGPPEVRRYSYVIVANGHLWDPKLPDFPGEFSGEEIHSHHYRVADPYEDKRVLVVGIGNSAVDIAADLARRARQVFLSTRRSAWIMPKYIMGTPTDQWLRFLVRRLKLPVPLARGVVRHLARLTIGNQERFGVPRPRHPVWREHATLSQELLPYIGHGWIRMKPNVERLDGNEVAFVDASREQIDAIIYATGYKSTFAFLDPQLFHVEEGTPPPLYRRIVAVDHPGLLFAGLVQPIGPTIALVEIQARWIAALLTGQIAIPARSAMMEEVERHRARVAKRFVKAARYTLEVDFQEYAGELDRDLSNAVKSA